MSAQDNFGSQTALWNPRPPLAILSASLRASPAAAPHRFSDKIETISFIILVERIRLVRGLSHRIVALASRRARVVIISPAV